MTIKSLSSNPNPAISLVVLFSPTLATVLLSSNAPTRLQPSDSTEWLNQRTGEIPGYLADGPSGLNSRPVRPVG